MAESALIIRWGTPRAGREQLGVSLLLGAARHFAALAKAGKLERADIFVSDGCADLTDGGSIVLTGTSDQIAAVTHSTECRAMLLRGIQVASDFRVSRAATGAALLERMEHMHGMDTAPRMH